MEEILKENEYILGLSKVPLGTVLPLISASEEALIISASKDRILQFRQARNLARKLLKKLDPKFENFSILKEESGAPIFPKGIVGSISHTKVNEHSIIGVVISDVLEGVGIDIESVERRISDEVATLIQHSDEIIPEQGLKRLRWFCAKEATLKARRATNLSENKAECDFIELEFFGVIGVLVSL